MYKNSLPIIKQFKNIIVFSSRTNIFDGTAKIKNFNFHYLVKKFDENYRSVSPLVTIHNQNKYKEPVFIFPGYEGRLISLKPLITNFQRTAYCFQYPYEGSTGSILDLVPSITKMIESCLTDKKTINIYAHSFGGLIAMKVVKHFETKGCKIQLCLTDSSPYAIKLMIGKTFGNILDLDVYENNLIREVFRHLDINSDVNFQSLWKSEYNFEDKIDILISKIADKTPFSTKKLKAIFMASYNLIHSIYHYPENIEKLNANVTLIRSSEKILSFPDDFKISRYFKNPVMECFTEGHHFSMLNGLQTANLINNFF